MSDDLEPVRQVFDADMDPYVTEVKRGADEARRFGTDNQIASEDVSLLAEAVRTNTRELRGLRDALLADRAGLDSLRDGSMEAAGAVGHLRDDSAEASHEIKKMGDQALETKAKLDVMGLSGAGTASKISPLIGIIGALIGVGASVAPAFVAAGLGLGAFALFALPTLSQVTKGYQGVQQAQLAVQNATTAAARSTALANLKNQWAQMGPPIAAVVRQIQSFKQTFASLAQNSGFQKSTLGDIQLVFKTLQDVLPALLPLAKAGAVAMHGLLTALDQGVKSGGFLSFIQQMTAIVVPAMHAITQFGGALLSVLGRALEALAPLAAPLLNMLSGLVRALSGPLNALLLGFQRALFQILAAITPLLPGLSKLVGLLIGDVATGLTSIIPIIGQVIGLLGPGLLAILLDLEPVLANAFTPNSGFIMALKLLPTLLKPVVMLLTGLGSLLKNPVFAAMAVDAITLVIAFKGLVGILSLLKAAWAGLTVVMEMNPFVLAISAIVLLVVAIVELWKHCAGFRNFWKGLWADIQNIMAPVVSWIHNSLNNMTRWWKDHGDQVMRIVKIAWTLITAYIKIEMAVIESVIKVAMAVIKAIWTTVWDAARTVVITVWNVIRAVIVGTIEVIQHTILFVLDLIEGHWSAAWHQLVLVASSEIHMVASVIKAVASGFITLLYNAGRDIIQGLINGVRAMFGAVMGVISSIGSAISGAFSSVLHIFSPSQVFHDHGRNTMLGYINGIRSMLPMVRSTMIQAAQIMLPGQSGLQGLYGRPSASVPAAAAAGAGGVGGAAGGGTIIVQVDGRKLFEVMQAQTFWYNIRNSGAVTGTVKPG